MFQICVEKKNRTELRIYIYLFKKHQCTCTRYVDACTKVEQSDQSCINWGGEAFQFVMCTHAQPPNLKTRVVFHDFASSPILPWGYFHAKSSSWAKILLHTFVTVLYLCFEVCFPQKGESSLGSVLKSPCKACVHTVNLF